MKVGDLITTYYSGFWRLDKIERRFVTEGDVKRHPSKNWVIGEEYSPLFYFSQVATDKGITEKLSKKQKYCCASFCNPAKEKIEGIIKQNKNLLKLIEQYDSNPKNLKK